MRAGLGTAWINRTGGGYPAYFTAPDLSVASLLDLAGRSPEACPGPDREVPARVWSHAGDGL